MRKYTIPQPMSVEYFLGDHLGSTSLTTDANGAKVSELRYKPWGETRYAGGITSTQYQYTGQFSYESDFGLYFYQSRFYDPSIGRFSSPDTIIPEQSQGVQAWDRYAYTSNNPVRYNDPSGHCLVLCTAIIGAAVSLAVDYYITTQVNHEQYTVEKALVAATVGAIGGAIGAGIIAPIAELAGATVFAGAMWVASPTTAMVIGVTAELTTGAVLSATTNVVLAPAHRELDAYFEGEDLTWDSYVDNINEHWTNDAIVGASSYALSTTISEGLATTFYPPQTVTQSILYSTMQGAGVGSSNTDLLDFALPDFDGREIEGILIQ
jgi:RHS repeat-associated protein